MNKNKIVSALVSSGVVALSAGCSLPVIDDADKKIDRDIVKTDRVWQKEKVKPESFVSMEKDMFVVGESFKVDSKKVLPPVFNKSVSFSQLTPISFQELTSLVSSELKVKIVLMSDAIDYLNGVSGTQDSDESFPTGDTVGQENVDAAEMAMIMDDTYDQGNGLVGQDLTFKFDYDGKLEGLIDTLTTKANLSWEWKNNYIQVFRHKNKTFNLDMRPQSNEFSADIASGKSSDDDGGSSSSSSIATHIESKTGSIYTSVEGDVKTMLSADGRYSISEQMGTLTVTDTPEVLDRVNEYVETINGLTNMRISNHIEIYEITSDDEGNFGLDMDIVRNASDSSKFGGGYKSNLSGMLTGALESIIDVSVIGDNMNFKDSRVLLNTLSKYNKVSLMTNYWSHTTNGQPVPIQIADEQFYLKSVTTTEDEDGNESTEVEPGSVLSGLTMNLNPRVISNGKVNLQFTVDMSNLNDIETLEFGDTLIQLPDRSGKTSVHNVIVKSGQSSMIAGFERTVSNHTTNTNTTKSTWLLGGKKEADKRRVVTLLIVTPFVMSD